MERAKEVDSAYSILKKSEESILSSKDVAEEMGVSRQYAHQRLEDAKERGEVEKVKIGPSVGWHPSQRWDGQLESDISSLPIGRSSGVCVECSNIFDDGDEVIGCYERLESSHSWDIFELACDEHVKNARHAPTVIGHANLIDEELNTHKSTFAYVKGRISEEHQELDDGRKRMISMLRDVKLLTLLRPE